MKRILLLALTVAVLSMPLKADWLDYPVSADTFTGTGSLKWNVTFNEDSSASYVIRDGDTCIVSFVLFNTHVSGTGISLHVKLPAGVYPTRYTIAFGKAGYGDQSVDVGIKVFDDKDYISIEPWPGVFNRLDGSFSLVGQITFPVCYGSAPCSAEPKRRAVKR